MNYQKKMLEALLIILCSTSQIQLFQIKNISITQEKIHKDLEALEKMKKFFKNQEKIQKQLQIEQITNNRKLDIICDGILLRYQQEEDQIQMQNKQKLLRLNIAAGNQSLDDQDSDLLSDSGSELTRIESNINEHGVSLNQDNLSINNLREQKRVIENINDEILDRGEFIRESMEETLTIQLADPHSQILMEKLLYDTPLFIDQSGVIQDSLSLV